MDKNRFDKPYVIGISGGSGSGKTTFVKSLKSTFDDSQVSVLTMDNYYVPREQQLIDENGIRNFDLPKSIDIDAFKSDLKKLMIGETVIREEYTYNNEKAEANQIITKSASVIIIEGLFIFYDQELFDLQSLKVLVNAKDVIKVIRRIHRDQVERNYPIEDVLYRYQHHVLPSYENYIAPYVEDIDLIINNNKSF